jgi:O-antigen ligase
MSTLAPPQFGGTRVYRAPAEPRTTVAGSAFRLLVTYGLLVPLLFFAVRGNFSIHNVDFNHPASEAQAYNPDFGQGNLLHSVELILAYGLVSLLMLPHWKSILAACGRNYFILSLPALAIFSTLWSQEPVRTLAFSVLATILTVLGVYFATRFTPRQQMQVFLFVGLASTLLSFLLVVAWPRAGIDYKNATVGFQGIYPHKNICAVLTIGFLTPAFFYKFSGRFGQLKRAGYILLLTALIIGTTARTGLIILGFTLLFIGVVRFLRGVRPLERVLVGWFLPVASIAGTWFIYTNQAEIARDLGKDPTLSGRTTIWAIAFLAIVKRPIAGFGYDAFWTVNSGEARQLAIAAHDPGLSNAENGILQLWLELGLIGVILLGFILLRTCRNAIACLRSDTPEYAIWYMSILFITLLSLIDGNKFMFPNAIEWTMFVMADVGLAREARRVRTAHTALA